MGAFSFAVYSIRAFGRALGECMEKNSALSFYAWDMVPRDSAEARKSVQ